MRLFENVGQETERQGKRGEDASAASLGSGLIVSQNLAEFREGRINQNPTELKWASHLG